MVCTVIITCSEVIFLHPGNLQVATDSGMYKTCVTHAYQGLIKVLDIFIFENIKIFGSFEIRKEAITVMRYVVL